MIVATIAAQTTSNVDSAGCRSDSVSLVVLNEIRQLRQQLGASGPVTTPTACTPVIQGTVLYVMSNSSFIIIMKDPCRRQSIFVLSDLIIVIKQWNSNQIK